MRLLATAYFVCAVFCGGLLTADYGCFVRWGGRDRGTVEFFGSVVVLSATWPLTMPTLFERGVCNYEKKKKGVDL